MTAEPSPVTLTWTCQVCGFPIADRAGYLHVDLAKVGQYEAAKIAFEDKHRQGGFVGYSAAEWIDNRADKIAERAREILATADADGGGDYNRDTAEVDS